MNPCFRPDLYLNLNKIYESKTIKGCCNVVKYLVIDAKFYLVSFYR